MISIAHASPPERSSAPTSAPPPRAPVTPPSGWKAAPKLARAAASAAGTAVTKVVASEAWIEPSIGCYSTWLRLADSFHRERKTPLTINRAAQQLIAGLEQAGFTVREVVATPTATAAGGLVALRLSKAPYHGLLRAVVTSTEELDPTPHPRGGRATPPGDPGKSLVTLGNRKRPLEVPDGGRGTTDGAGLLDAVACVWNQREPSICAPACAKLMEAVR